MVEQKAHLDTLFKALADPARRTILTRLSEGPATIGEIADPLDMSFAGASKHVAVLVEARLITKTKSGRQQICTLRADPLIDVRNWIDRYAVFWSERLDALETALNTHAEIKGSAHDETD